MSNTQAPAEDVKISSDTSPSASDRGRSRATPEHGGSSGSSKSRQGPRISLNDAKKEDSFKQVMGFYVPGKSFTFSVNDDDDDDIVSLGLGKLGETREARIRESHERIHEDFVADRAVSVTTIATVSREFLGMFLDDIAVLSRMKHSNIVKFYAFSLKEAKQTSGVGPGDAAAPAEKYVRYVMPIFEVLPCSLSEVLYEFTTSARVESQFEGYSQAEILTEANKQKIALDVAKALQHVHTAASAHHRDGDGDGDVQPTYKCHGDIRPQKVLLSVRKNEDGSTVVHAKVKMVLQKITATLFDNAHKQSVNTTLRLYDEENQKVGLFPQLYMHADVRHLHRKGVRTEKHNDVYGYGITVNEMYSMERPSGEFELSENLSDIVRPVVARCTSVRKDHVDGNDYFGHIVEMLTQGAAT